MGNLSDIVVAMLMLLAGLEVVLFIFKGTLLHVGQAQGLERQIEDLKVELKAAQERCREREPELAAAVKKSEEALAALRRASTELAESQQPRDVLVHKIGEPPGLQFRGAVSKTLPADAEESQVLLWSYRHLVDVWAANPDEAVALASRSFSDQAGYVLSAFQPLDTRPAPRPDEAEAGG